MKEKKDQSKT